MPTPKRRVPLELEQDDIELLLKLRAKLEDELKKPLTLAETIRTAIKQAVAN